MSMYSELAEWYPLLTNPSDYTDEAAFYAQRLRAAAQRPLRRLLELGAGAGYNAVHLKADYDYVTLTDLSAAMLGLSRAVNPECRHVQGDMTTLRLEERFDAVFLHDAACYLLDRAQLQAAAETAFLHLEPGGVFLVCPDETTESFQEGCDHYSGEDAETGRALHVLEWYWDPDPTDEQTCCEYVYVMRDGDGVRTEHDHQLHGLFPEAVWAAALQRAGFVGVETHWMEEDGTRYPRFVGTRPT